MSGLNTARLNSSTASSPSANALTSCPCQCASQGQKRDDIEMIKPRNAPVSSRTSIKFAERWCYPLDGEGSVSGMRRKTKETAYRR